MSGPWNVTLRIDDDEQVFQTIEREDDHHLLTIGSSGLTDVTIAHPDVAPIQHWLIVNDEGYTWLRSSVSNETVRFGVGDKVVVGGSTIGLPSAPVRAELTWKLAFRVVGRPGSDGDLHVFHAERVIVGRDKKADLSLKSGNVSRKHCMFYVRNGQLRVRDLGSSNGMHVNGMHHKDVAFGTADKLFLGDFIVSLAEPPKPVPLQR